MSFINVTGSRLRAGHRIVGAVSQFIACGLLLLSATAHSQEVPGCGDLANAYGPFDYNSAFDRDNKLPIVESHHFTEKVENLVEGESGDLALDIDYTLRAFPNHARALWAMARYQLRMGRAWSPADKFRPIECYFDRALAWRPNDATVWMVYGMYLARKGDKEGALQKYEHALKLQPKSVEVNYNAGLAFFEVKQYARARELAQKAYAMGYPLPGLRNKLKRIGQWSDAPQPSKTTTKPATNSAGATDEKK